MWNEAENLLFIERTADYIAGHIKGRSEYEYYKQGFIELCSDINRCLKIWTGETWVGDKKTTKIKTAFQKFFSSFHLLLQSIQDNPEQYSDDERMYATNSIYHGTIYRYLGHNDPRNKNRVMPIYNEIFVSWNKEPRCSNIESKLYGTMTWLSADVQSPYFGIDLEGVEAAFFSLANERNYLTKSNEHEVVFPTIKECITEVKYIEEDEEDAQT